MNEREQDAMTEIVMMKEKPTHFMKSKIITIEWNGQKVQAVEGQFIYRARTERGFSIDRARGTLRKNASVLRGTSSVDDRGVGVLFAAPDLLTREHGATLMQKDPLIEWMEPVMLDHGCLDPNDPRYSQQWGLKAIKAPDGWGLAKANGKVVVAVLDSGAPLKSSALSHEDLNGNQFVIGLNVLSSSSPALDDNGHGTHVAGIVGAWRGNGVGVAGMWDGSVYIVKVLDENQNGTQISFQDGVREAVFFAQSIDARLVINYSGGGPDSGAKKVALERIVDAGALLVAAVGNDSGQSVLYPAAYAEADQHVIAVTSVGKDLSHSAFSSRGPSVTVAAPGEDVLSTTPDYRVTLNDDGLSQTYGELSGTSQATPFVSAIAAMVWAKWPDLTAEQVRQRIENTATAVAGGAREDFGAGIVNASSALT